MRRASLVLSVLFLLPRVGGTADVVRALWEKSPDSDVDRFCIAVFGKCLGLIDSRGRVVARFDPPRMDLHDFSDGLMATDDPATNKYGYINEDGEWVIPPRFAVTWRFQGGRAVVREAFSSPQRVIDRNGSFIGPPAKHFGIGSFSQGLAPLRPERGELAGYISDVGDWAISQRFRNAREFSEDDKLAAVQSSDGKWGYIDTTGAFKIAPEFLFASDFKHGRTSVVSEGPCWYWIKSEYDLFAPPAYISLPGGQDEPSWEQPAGLPECRMTLIDTNGKPASRYTFQWLEDFTEDGISAKVANKWGIVGRDGEWITPPVWDDVLPFSEGLAGVYKRGEGWGYVDALGIVVIEPTYWMAQPFSEGLAAVKDQRGAFYIRPAGTQAIEREFGEAGPFRRGIAHVMVSTDTWEYIDKEGRTVFRYTRNWPRE